MKFPHAFGVRNYKFIPLSGVKISALGLPPSGRNFASLEREEIVFPHSKGMRKSHISYRGLPPFIFHDHPVKGDFGVDLSIAKTIVDHYSGNFVLKEEKTWIEVDSKTGAVKGTIGAVRFCNNKHYLFLLISLQEPHS